MPPAKVGDAEPKIVGSRARAAAMKTVASHPSADRNTLPMSAIDARQLYQSCQESSKRTAGSSVLSMD
jgi:hypothetical protein